MTGFFLCTINHIIPYHLSYWNTAYYLPQNPNINSKCVSRLSSLWLSPPLSPLHQLLRLNLPSNGLAETLESWIRHCTDRTSRQAATRNVLLMEASPRDALPHALEEVAQGLRGRVQESRLGLPSIRNRVIAHYRIIHMVRKRYLMNQILR